MLIKSLNTSHILDITPGQEITITLENPLFADDRMPVPVSTGIEFPLSPSNSKEFGFLDAMLSTPTVQKLPAAIIIGGIEIFTGELQFDEFSDGTLKYTFVGACSTDSFEGKIHEIECHDYSGMRLSTFVDNARKGAYQDVGLPMIVRKENSAKIEYLTKASNAECSIIDKYANYIYTDEPYIIPALKVGYLLEKIHPDLLMPSVVADYTDKLAILGTYKPEGWQDERYGIPFTKTTRPVAVYIGKFKPADSLPDMTKTVFLTNLLKMFCATLFPDGSSYKILTNDSIVKDKSFIDWTDKVADGYSIEIDENSSYTLEYANPEQNYTPSKEDDLGQEGGVPDGIQTASNYEELISKFQSSEDYINVKITTTGNIYSGKVVKARLYYRFVLGVYGKPPIYNDLETAIPTMDIVYQANVDKIEIAGATADASTYDNSIGFICSKSIPANVAVPIYQESSYAQVTLREMAPVVELPTVGGSRPSDVYIGLLIQNNFLDQGNYFALPTPYIDGGSEMSDNIFSIALAGEKGLYNKFHKSFAEWLVKKKDPIKKTVFLSPSDLALLRLWRKVMVCNQLFIIKTMELTISDKSDIIFASASLVKE